MTKEEAIEHLEYQNLIHFGGQSEALKMAILALSEDVRPNIHGHWKEDNGYGLPYRCSICGSGGLKFWNFCRDCGADMREPKGEKGTEG